MNNCNIFRRAWWSIMPNSIRKSCGNFYSSNLFTKHFAMFCGYCISIHSIRCCPRKNGLMCDNFLVPDCSFQWSKVCYFTLIFYIIIICSLGLRPGQVRCVHFQVSLGQFRSFQVISGQFRSVQVSSGQFRSVQASSGQFRSIQVSPGQSKSVQVSSSQFTSVQVRSIKISSCNIKLPVLT